MGVAGYNKSCVDAKEAALKLLPDSDSGMYLSFIRTVAAKLREGDAPPKDLDQWRGRREALRASLTRALGLASIESCPLEPQVLTEIDRPGWRIELTTFQTTPGVRRTATLYRPKSEGRKPAVLCVHGHWPWARIDPVVQARCLGLVQLGYVVLAVDAFGAGERAVEPKAGAYHGALTGASLWPIGKPLAGIQLFENMRAVDYLVSLPDVDANRIGVTGASGGGNQTMYLGAYDDRLQAVAPVCSVGTYTSYLGAACCTCEVVPGAMRWTEEGGILAMTAPRALLVISASQDAIQFSPGEAKKSIAWARSVYQLHRKDDKLSHEIFESPHAYSQPMRERMYGFFDRWLKGNEKAPERIAEPPITTDEVRELRCFPRLPTATGRSGPAASGLHIEFPDAEREESSRAQASSPLVWAAARPIDFMTIPKFAAEQGARLARSQPLIDHVSQWEAHVAGRRRRLVEEVFGGFPERTPMKVHKAGVEEKEGRRFEGWVVETEVGVSIPLIRVRTPRTAERAPICLLLHGDGKDAALGSQLFESLLGAGHEAAVCDLRATGESKVPNDKIADAAGHNSAEWGMWIGRPMLGQWAWDVIRLMEHLRATTGRRVALHAMGPIGVAALCAAAVEPTIDDVVCLEPTVSLTASRPYADLPMGLLAPGFLEVGDVCDVASWIAPRPLRIIGGRGPDGGGVWEAALVETFSRTRAAYSLLGASKQFRLLRLDEKPL
jgi:dienelactone hydrolase